MVKTAVINHSSFQKRRKAYFLFDGWRLVKASAISCLTGLLLLCVGYGLFHLEIRKVSTHSSLQSADAVVVLTGDDGRIEVALDLLQSRKGKRLLISGVHNTTTKSAILKAAGRKHPTLTCCIDLGHTALDTRGNAMETAQWAMQNGYKKLIIVTSDYHMPRSLIELANAASDLELIPYTTSAKASNFQDFEAFKKSLREYGKYIAARIRIVSGA
jgi:uncharacterized SAM-binding protein YcdF (DUF218 family)